MNALPQIQVATIQFSPIYASLDENRTKIWNLALQAIEQGASILVFPEMTTTGYIFSKNQPLIQKLAEEKQGKTFELLSSFCKENQVYLAYGYPEKLEHRFYNSQNLINPQGELILHYQKQNLFSEDRNWASKGETGYQSIETPLGKIGLGICMDLNFRCFVDFHIQQNTQLILFSANWIFSNPISNTEYWLKRWGDFRKIACISNRYGKEFGTVFCGNSAIFENQKLVAQAPLKGDMVLVTTHILS